MAQGRDHCATPPGPRFLRITNPFPALTEMNMPTCVVGGGCGWKTKLYVKQTKWPRKDGVRAPSGDLLVFSQMPERGRHLSGTRLLHETPRGWQGCDRGVVQRIKTATRREGGKRSKHILVFPTKQGAVLMFVVCSMRRLPVTSARTIDRRRKKRKNTASSRLEAATPGRTLYVHMNTTPCARETKRERVEGRMCALSRQSGEQVNTRVHTELLLEPTHTTIKKKKKHK